MNWKRFFCEWWNRKSLKHNKSLGGRIAHLEVPSSQKFLNPPNKPKSKKRECQAKQFVITRPSVREFFDWWKYVSVWSISHFGLFSFLVLYIIAVVNLCMHRFNWQLMYALLYYCNWQLLHALLQLRNPTSRQSETLINTKMRD